MCVLAPYRSSATGSQQYTAERHQIPVTSSDEALLTHRGPLDQAPSMVIRGAPSVFYVTNKLNQRLPDAATRWVDGHPSAS
jgi:hypothetical protein